MVQRQYGEPPEGSFATAAALALTGENEGRRRFWRLDSMQPSFKTCGAWCSQRPLPYVLPNVLGDGRFSVFFSQQL